MTGLRRERIMRPDWRSPILALLSFNQTLPQSVRQADKRYADTEVLKGLGSPGTTAGGERHGGPQSRSGRASTAAWDTWFWNPGQLECVGEDLVTLC